MKKVVLKFNKKTAALEFGKTRGNDYKYVTINLTDDYGKGYIDDFFGGDAACLIGFVLDSFGDDAMDIAASIADECRKYIVL